MGKIFKDAISRNWAFWVCLIAEIFLLVGGALTPPAFVIDASIFKATGWLFAFGALGSFSRAVEKGLDASIKKGDFTFNVRKQLKDDTNSNDNIPNTSEF